MRISETHTPKNPSLSSVPTVCAYLRDAHPKESVTVEIEDIAPLQTLRKKEYCCLTYSSACHLQHSCDVG